MLESRKDLSSAIDQLIEDIENEEKHSKVYKQMKDLLNESGSETGSLAYKELAGSSVMGIVIRTIAKQMKGVLGLLLLPK